VGIESVLLFIGIAICVAIIAGYLVTVSFMLNDVSFTVGTVLVGVRSIALQVQPIGGVVREIVRDIQSIEEDLSALVIAAEEEEELEPPVRGQVGAGRR
jgi:hypothetical protein